MDSSTPTFYQFAVNNVAIHITSTENRNLINRGKSYQTVDAFQASEVLEIVFCKAKEEIVLDIIKAVEKIRKSQ